MISKLHRPFSLADQTYYLKLSCNINNVIEGVVLMRRTLVWLKKMFFRFKTLKLKILKN